ncbi:MAG: sulfite exporter TauE/SafE family protein [Proteobacteria bacterium]|nr:sulfite exporter TauE/SafE family protein [Pseudomonadota bacterium]
MHLVQNYFSEDGLIRRKRNPNTASPHTWSEHSLKAFRILFKQGAKTLIFWVILDIVYIVGMFSLNHPAMCGLSCGFFLPHFYGIFVGTMVMFTGLGAGVLWFPFLTFLGYAPTEIVPISLFNQIMGKGSGSFKYFNDDLLERKIIRHFIPYTLAGVLIGFSAGFIMPASHEKWLYIIFVLVVVFLLIRITTHTPEPVEEDKPYIVPEELLQRSNIIVLISSVFTGLLSIGNSDWLIPYMESRLKMPGPKAVATGIFVMFCAALFYLFLTIWSVMFGNNFLPGNLSILFATCSGVILGGQIGSRLIHINWLKKHQRHAFIIMMSLSAIHITWEFILKH